MSQYLRGIFGIIEAARALKIVMAPTPENQRAIKIGCSRDEFPEKLWELACAIEKFDAANADSRSVEVEAPSPEALDVGRFKVAVDEVFRWMRKNGIDVTEPYEIVARTIGHEGAQKKSGKGYKPLPSFAPNGFKKAVGSGPLLNLGLSAGERPTPSSLADKELRAEMTETTLGSAAPRRNRS